MMRKIFKSQYTWLLLGMLAAVLLALSRVHPAASQPDQIIIQYADDLRTIDVLGNSELKTLIGQVSERIVFQYANANRLILIEPAPLELKNLLGQTADRIVFQYANANRLVQVVAPPQSLLSLLGQTVDRIVFQYANANRLVQVAYPKELINDKIAPTISDVLAVPLGVGTLKVTWKSNELARSTVKYGFSPGSYPQIVEDPNFRLSHEAQLTNIPVGVTVYYRILSTDRSGNAGQSGEFQVKAAKFIYLPYVER